MTACLLLFVSILFVSAFADSGDLVVVLFTDVNCTSCSELSNCVPTLAKNHTCSYSGALHSYYMQTSDASGVSTYGFGCSDTACTSCLYTGTANAGDCVNLMNDLYIQGFGAASGSMKADSYSTRTIVTKDYAYYQTCSDKTGTTFDVTLGSCVATQQNTYQYLSEISNSTEYGFSVIRNCTDNTCTNCYNGGWYTPDSTCVRVDGSKGVVDAHIYTTSSTGFALLPSLALLAVYVVSLLF